MLDMQTTTLEIIRFSVDLLAPGAILPLNLAKLYTSWEEFHSNRIMYPIMPTTKWLDLNDQGGKVLVDCMHIRVTPVGLGFLGPLDGVIDYLLTLVRLDYFMGKELPRVAQKAIKRANPYQHGLATCGWMEIWEVDEEKQTGRGMCDLEYDWLEEILRKERAGNTIRQRTIFDKE